jgi:tetratricopeptide (TPR) repeat protein
LIGGVGGGAFLYQDRIMAMLDGQPSLVAQRRPGTSPAVAVNNELRTPAVSSAGTSESLAAAEREALLRAAELARAQEATQAQAHADAEARVRAEVEMRVREIADAAAAQARIEAEAEVQREAAAEQAASAASAAMQGVQPDTTVAPAAFQISRRRGPRRVHKDLVRAFDAFQRGDDGQAMKIYQAVLKREPRNRDAMLGVAAISLRAGAVDQAAGYYMEVLRRNPRDGAAQAGLIALQDNLDPVSGESRVKELLEHSPRDANLYFSLGNLYAQQGRWPEAQQAYFEAYRLDDVNPDYAFNLAVSLDQLAQSRPALEYYRRAEQLADEFPATFDANVARLRAAELAGL